MNWVFEHSQDSDFDLPVLPATVNTSHSSSLDPSAVDLIVSMGFGKDLAMLALKKNVIFFLGEFIFKTNRYILNI